MKNHRIHLFTLVLAMGLASAARAEEPKYTHAPVTFWLAPHIGTAGLLSRDLETNFSLSLLASAYGKLEGADIGVGASWVMHGARGVQITAGANIVEEEMRGLQLSGGFNYAGALTGAQISLVNYGGTISGAQVGLVNIADTVQGTQLGLVNFAKDSRAPFGIFNFIENGQHHLELWSSETMPVNLGIKLGGRTIYSVLTAGIDGQTRWSAGLGLGAHRALDGGFSLDTELFASHVNENEAWTTALNTLGSLRLLVGYELDRHFAIFGGPTLNVMVSDKGYGEGLGLYQGARLTDDDSDVTVRMWPGLVAGVRI